MLLHFTSGTTGTPKGAIHVHEAVVAHHRDRHATRSILHPDDMFWCTADPGWVTGTSYGIIAPLLHGVTSIVDEADFDAERWYGILQDQKVSVWYTAPDGDPHADEGGRGAARTVLDFRALRFIASVGEPLNPEAVWWGSEALGTADSRQLVADRNRRHHDRQHAARWTSSRARWASRCRASTPHRRTDRSDGTVEEVDAPDVEGELALRPDGRRCFAATSTKRSVIASASPADAI